MSIQGFLIMLTFIMIDCEIRMLVLDQNKIGLREWPRHDRCCRIQNTREFVSRNHVIPTRSKSIRDTHMMSHHLGVSTDIKTPTCIGNPCYKRQLKCAYGSDRIHTPNTFQRTSVEDQNPGCMRGVQMSTPHRTHQSGIT